MDILIVVATETEVTGLRNLINADSTIFQNHSISFLIAGVGLVATTYHLTFALSGKKYDLILNVGLCGAFNRDLKLGDIVNITYEAFGDLGVEDDEYFLRLDEIGLVDTDSFPYKDKWLVNDTRWESPSLLRLPAVKGISVNTVHGNKQSIEKTLRKFDAAVESMEGAALAYVCLLRNQAFLQIRSVSNYVEKRDRSKWNIPLALKNLNAIIVEILKELE